MKKKISGVKKKRGFLTEQYSESWNYIKNSKNFIGGAVLIFFIFALIGFLFPTPENLRIIIIDFLKNILEKTQGYSLNQWIFFIFVNNLLSSFFGFILGFFFGVFPVIGAVANGYVLGFVGKNSVAEAGIFSLWKILPHGVFELPAIFISLGMGLKLGSSIFQNKKSESLKNYFDNSVRVFVFVVIPLLIVAAIIEGSLIFFAR